MTTNMYQIDQM